MIDDLLLGVGRPVETLVAADIGSGTGIMSRLLLERGVAVYAVEPNAEMRAAAERSLGGYQGFRSVAADAGDTTLEDQSADLVVCAQAFHWFANETAAAEMSRISRSTGLIVLAWNDRVHEGDRFHVEYEKLLVRYGTDYSSISHRNVTGERIAELFSNSEISVARYDNQQLLDFDGLRGRLESSSYCPKPPGEQHSALIAALRELFDSEKRDGQISLRYDTLVYYLR
jgi:ubiquinone/menaquinone biosynthesis C-methylase UbiE